MTTANDEQIAFWSGRAGERWVQEQEQMDRNLRPFGQAAMDAARVAAGERVVDIGCGCGDTTLALAALTGPGGFVTGVDISRPMLERARVRAAGVPHVAFVESDASVAPLPERTDLLFSRFGVMFFADPGAAFTHLHGQLSRDGRLSFACWRSPADNPWATLPLDAVTPHLPPAPPSDPFAPGPFAFADASRVRAMLERSGFRDVALTPFTCAARWTEGPSLDEAVAYFSQLGPAARRLADAPPEAKERALQALAEALAPHVTREGVVLDASIWVVTAGA